MLKCLALHNGLCSSGKLSLAGKSDLSQIMVSSEHSLGRFFSTSQAVLCIEGMQGISSRVSLLVQGGAAVLEATSISISQLFKPG